MGEHDQPSKWHRITVLTASLMLAMFSRGGLIIEPPFFDARVTIPTLYFALDSLACRLAQYLDKRW